MKAIYEPKGRAAEYAKLACNLYEGCTHGCKYCYVPRIPGFPKAEVFHGYAEAKTEFITRRILEMDAIRLQKLDNQEPIQLCFTCDPYQPQERHEGIARHALLILSQYNQPVSILTKAGKLAERDLDILSQDSRNWFGVTLTTDLDKHQKQWEINAASTWERMESIKKAKRLRIKTWVSLEPVIYPDAVYRIINYLYPHVDLWRVGKLNYHPHAKTIDWPKFRERVIEELEAVGANYYIKKDLKEAK